MASKVKFFVLALIILSLFSFVAAEEKPSDNFIVPKLTPAETADAPELTGGTVAPPFGERCTKFFYIVTYKDSKSRPPEYVRVWLDGTWHDMRKVKGDYNNGAMYLFDYVPDSGGNIFYYFEASNGAGKARSGIIDSPNQGPMIYSESFENNSVVLLNKSSNKPLMEYPLGKSLVSSVAISENGKYAAASTTTKLYFFSVEDKKLLWQFCMQCAGEDHYFSSASGVSISSEGDYIAAALGGKLYFFKKDSNTPVWEKDVESNAIGVDISNEGDLIAVGVGNSGEKGDRAFFFDGSGGLVGSYKAQHADYVQTGNFYRPAMTPDGEYTAISTGCPDRRAYLFKKDGSLVFRTEQLTQDSPVHKSAISDDGETIAYSLDHMQGKEILVVYNKAGQKLWGFSSSTDSTARAVSISSSGEKIAIGTSVGKIYLFSKSSSTPIWTFLSTGSFTQIGDLELSDDGAFLAAGGTTKKIYFFSTAKNEPLWEYTAGSWINAIAFNGEYIFAGTGLQEYAFEGTENLPKKECSTIKEIYSESEIQSLFGQSMPSSSNTGDLAKCGNSICEPNLGETETNCAEDCSPNGLNGAPVNNGGQQNTGQTDGNYPQPMGQEECGNGICEGTGGESLSTCPNDCGGGGIITNPDANNPLEGQQNASLPLKDCNGFIDLIINFFSGLFGNPICK